MVNTVSVFNMTAKLTLIANLRNLSFKASEQCYQSKKNIWNKIQSPRKIGHFDICLTERRVLASISNIPSWKTN